MDEREGSDGREGGRQKDEGRQKVNFETGWYRGKLYISELPACARARAPAPARESLDGER